MSLLAVQVPRYRGARNQYPGVREESYTAMMVGHLLIGT